MYVIGESGVLRELEEAEIDVEAGVYDSVKCTPSDWEEMQEWMEEDESVGAVVVGSDSKFTFAKLAYASLMIQRGAIFVATNPDAGDLLGPGLYPGAGALASAVATASGVEPAMYCGKPSAFMLNLLSEHGAVDLSRTLVVGDRLDTDIAFGKAGGAALTALVLTGVPLRTTSRRSPPRIRPRRRRRPPRPRRRFPRRARRPRLRSRRDLRQRSRRPRV